MVPSPLASPIFGAEFSTGDKTPSFSEIDDDTRIELDEAGELDELEATREDELIEGLELEIIDEEIVELEARRDEELIDKLKDETT